MRVLAVDLGGSLVGYAYFDAEPARLSELLSVGVWNLTPKRIQSPGLRWLRLRSSLEQIRTVSRLRVDLVVYEEVRAHPRPRKRGPGGKFPPPSTNVAAAHAYGGAQAILLAWCEEQGIEFASVPVSSVKKAATGKGGGKGTGKKDVLAAARERWPTLVFPDDNASDAAFIGLAAIRDLSLAKEEPPDGTLF